MLIHDGVRPLIDAALIDRVLDGLAAHAGGAAGAAGDRHAEAGRAAAAVRGTVERAGLCPGADAAGLSLPGDPRGAPGALPGAELTDDVALAEAAGLRSRWSRATRANLKITAPADLARAERLLGARLHAADRARLRRPSPRRRATASCCSACGCAEPFRLIGHSDADVGLHAVTDALLGALGAGDIGSHFPPTDPRWAGAEFGAVPRTMRGS